MRQQSSAATQIKRTDFQNLFVPQDEIDRCAKNIFGLVEQRRLCAEKPRKRTWTTMSEDWFSG